MSWKFFQTILFHLEQWSLKKKLKNILSLKNKQKKKSNEIIRLLKLMKASASDD